MSTYLLSKYFFFLIHLNAYVKINVYENKLLDEYFYKIDTTYFIS